jgi:hypothetical protein
MHTLSLEAVMRATLIRRLWMVAVSTVILALFTTAALSAASVSAGQVLLAISGLLFGYIVVRLSQSLFAAGAARRRRARRGLILAAAVPALVLTPTVIGSSPPGFTSMIRTTRTHA